MVVLHPIFFAIKNKHIQKHQYEFLCGSSNFFPMKITWDTDHKEKISLQIGFFCEPSNGHLDSMTWDTDHKEKVSLQNGLFCDSLNGHLY